MKYFLVFIVLIMACGGTEVSVAADKSRQCFDNCETHDDCMEGLWCLDHDYLKSVCIPKDCAICYADGMTCLFDKQYADDLEFPVCTFDVCLGH